MVFSNIILKVSSLFFFNSGHPFFHLTSPKNFLTESMEQKIRLEIVLPLPKDFKISENFDIFSICLPCILKLFFIYDTEENCFRHKRVAYDVPATQKNMAQAGLPEYLIERLAVGR